MFQHILVPTDFSKRSQKTLEIACQIATMSQGQVSLLHVIELIPHIDFEEFKDFYQKLETRANREMELLLKLYQQTGQPEVNSAIIYGQRVQTILEFAQDHQIDLIVLNSHKVDPNEPNQGWGTISYKVGILAQCPVLLVK
jgi:universal stress protein A